MAKKTEKTNLTPRERFLKVGSKRVQNVLKSIRLLSNCANKNGYEYTPAEYQKMVKAIDTSLDIMKNKFTQAPGAEKKETFSFS